MLEESHNWQHDLESKLNKSKGQVYTLEAELFLAEYNKRLKEDQGTVNDAM